MSGGQFVAAGRLDASGIVPLRAGKRQARSRHFDELVSAKCGFKFHKRCQLFIGTHNETFAVGRRVHNSDRIRYPLWKNTPPPTTRISASMAKLSAFTGTPRLFQPSCEDISVREEREEIHRPVTIQINGNQVQAWRAPAASSPDLQDPVIVEIWPDRLVTKPLGDSRF